MPCGVIHADLVLRLGAEGADEALGQPFTRPMDFTGRPTTTVNVDVAPGGPASAAALRAWVRRAVLFADSLPPKSVAAPRQPRHTRRCGYCRVTPLDRPVQKRDYIGA